MNKTDQLKKLLADATPGKWVVDYTPSRGGQKYYSDTVYIDMPNNHIPRVLFERPRPHLDKQMTDSYLGCFLRNNAPAILEVMEAVEQALPDCDPLFGSTERLEESFRKWNAESGEG